MRSLLVLSAFILFILTSCSEAFKAKLRYAEDHRDDMMAKGATVTSSAEVIEGRSSTGTTLTFSSCEARLQNAERERRANMLAVDYYHHVEATALEGESFMRVVCETTDDSVYSYLFWFDELSTQPSCMEVAEEMLDACLLNDTTKIKSLKDNAYLPDGELLFIHAENARNDSLYEGSTRSKALLGFRITGAEKFADLRLVSCNYECGNAHYRTYYTINVDVKTQKVVYLWMKTDAN